MIQNLRKFLKDIADAIREKTGKSELIKPIDFAEEIKGITAGGGSGEGGGSSWKYFRCTAPSAYNTYFIGVYSIVRVENPQLPHAIFLDSGLFWVMAQQDNTVFDSATAMAINMGMRVTNMSTIELTTVGEIYGEVINQMMTAGELTEITEAEFYDLNTLLSE